MNFPFTEQKVGNQLFLREFKENVDSEELVWHQDQEDRIIKVIESNGWKLQMDNRLPICLEEGKTYKIPAYLYHRVIKGDGDLIVAIKKIK